MTNTLVRGLVTSILIHAALFGAWGIGQTEAWKKFAARFPALKLALKPKPPAVQRPTTQSQQQMQLTFIEVDASQAAKEPPKDAKFFSSVSTEAANPTPSNLETPKIEGQQKDFPKITENARSKAQPAPPATDPGEQEQQARPRKRQDVGNLAMAKPQDKKVDGDDNTEAEKTERRRPRTLAEAKAGAIGEKSPQDGGVPRVALSGMVSARGTPLGDYYSQLVDAVRQSWHTILDRALPTQRGKVVVEFTLHPDGRISDVKTAQNTTGNLMQSLYCEMALQEPSPYRKWPVEMRRELRSEQQTLTFTFLYGE